MNQGTAVQVIVARKDHSFELDELALKKILLDPRIKDRKVVVLSVAGAYRTGKSFLLNFFLRFLHSRNWNEDPDAPLKGFDWRVGAERNTTGILMWSEPFEVKLANGEKACVLLMDTQGTFDTQSTVKDCATIFALSTMLSSVQVYNLMLNIHENDLQHLQFFTEYGRLALEKYKLKPFQDLYFLVRDWQYHYDYEYGKEGGEKLLNKRLAITVGQHSELQRLRQHIPSCFERIRCCLLPHPGKEASTSKHFDGRLADIDAEFKVHVQEFVTSLLSTENLVVKEINGTPIIGKELFEYFKEFLKIFQSNKLPEPMTIFEATAEANNCNALSKAKEEYMRRMDSVCGGDKSYVNPKKLASRHRLYKQEAVELFQSTIKMGGEEMSRRFQDRLEQELEELYIKYERNNSAKKRECKLCCISLSKPTCF